MHFGYNSSQNSIMESVLSISAELPMILLMLEHFRDPPAITAVQHWLRYGFSNNTVPLLVKYNEVKKIFPFFILHVENTPKQMV